MFDHPLFLLIFPPIEFSRVIPFFTKLVPSFHNGFFVTRKAIRLIEPELLFSFQDKVIPYYQSVSSENIVKILQTRSPSIVLKECHLSIISDNSLLKIITVDLRYFLLMDTVLSNDVPCPWLPEILEILLLIR